MVILDWYGPKLNLVHNF